MAIENNIDPFAPSQEELNSLLSSSGQSNIDPFAPTEEELASVDTQQQDIDPFMPTEEELSSLSGNQQQEVDPFAPTEQELASIGDRQQNFDPFMPTQEELGGLYANADNKSFLKKLGAAVSKGYSKGVTGLLTGSKEDNTKIDSFVEHVAELGTELASDVPAFATGGALGAAIGGIIGSVVPGLGTVAGAAAGSAFFGMAMPSMIKSGFSKYRDYVKKGGEASFGGFLEGAGDVIFEGAKAGTVGVATANMGRFIPLLKKVPVWNKILNTTIGRKATATGLEFTGLTGMQALIDGELPTKEQMLDNAMTIAGMKIAHRFGAPIKNLIPEEFKRAPRSLVKALPESIQKPILGAADYLKDVKVKMQDREHFDWLKEHVGEREAQIVGEQLDIKSKITKRNKDGKLIPKYTQLELEDAIYLRQKTGNPRFEGDTYEKVQERSSNELKKFVSVDVDNFFKNKMKLINADERLKNINPRDRVIDSYIPGLWEGDASKVKLPKGFNLDNPFANRKQFDTIMQAAKEAGLKPRFNNIVEFMASYSDATVKMLTNSKLVGEMEKVNAEKNLIVRTSDGTKYADAKKLGYIPFEDLFLSRYKGKDASGNTKWGSAEGPVLLHPQFAEAFQGIFNKETPKLDNAGWRTYDNLADIIRFSRVALSPFHYGSLMESASGALGVTKALDLKGLARNGDAFLNDKTFMADAARHGLKLGKPIEYAKGGKLVDKILDSVFKKGKTLTPEEFSKESNVEKGVNKLKKGYNYLFDTFHPRLKAVTYNEFVTKEINRLIKEGKPPTEAERKVIKRNIAEFVNNIYGGQNWETAKFFNNKKTMKWIRRAIAYPDWTISALKQAGGVGANGLKGRVSRTYWAKYIINMSLMQGTLKYLFGGIDQKDKKNNSITGLRWSREKAAKEFWKGDPSKWYMFPLPDVNVKVGGGTFNPGRDAASDKKLYGHFGKQALEILGWGTKPFQTFFGKSNPIFQLAWQQLLGSTPSGDTSYPARGKYKRGEFLPWDATKPFTAGRAVSRAKALVQGVTPFSVSTLASRGVGPYLGSAGGLFPVSQGMSLRKAESFVEKALKKRDYKELNSLKEILLNNGYKSRSVKALVTRVRNRINREKRGLD